MNELDDANLDKSLRDKFAPYGRQPSEQVWGKINQRINQPAAAARPNRPWLVPVLIMAGLLLVLLGNLLPRLGAPELAETATKPTRTGQHNEAVPTPAAGHATAPAAAQAPAHANAQAAASGTGTERAAISDRKTHSRAAAAQPSSATRIRTAAPANPFAGQVAVAPIAQSTSDNNTATNSIGTQLENVTATEQTKPAAIAISPDQTSGIPASLQVLAQLEQQLQPVFAGSPEAEAQPAVTIKTLNAHKAELALLQQRTDSLLKKLETPEYLKPQPVASYDSAMFKKKPSRWSAVLAYAPEHSFLTLHAPASDTLNEMRRNHETGRSGYNASVAMEFQLSNRLSIGAGLGYSTYGSELRLTNRDIFRDVVNDTTTTINTVATNTQYTVVTVHIDSIYQLNPVLNSSGQVISYDSILIVSHDSTTHTITQTDSLTTVHEVVTPITISETEVTTYKVLKPEYRFVTIPVTLRYRLTPAARWWADVAVGAQLQLFRGGTQAFTTDGRNYESRKISRHEGPFRPVNLALMGNFALNYALTPRMSVSVAPAVRWQTMSVYKKETGLKQQPLATGLQFGIRFAL